MPQDHWLPGFNFNVEEWECAPKARIISGGRFHPESCRLIRKLTSGSCGQLHGSKPRDKGRRWAAERSGGP
jgi:hypothetical protein